VLVSKYCDHLPLYRQSEIYARAGVELERSTLADWLVEPVSYSIVVVALRRYVMAAGKVHADDTPVPVLAPGTARRRRAACGPMFAMIAGGRYRGTGGMVRVLADRKGEHPEQHLRTFRGALQADAYAGFNQLYKEDGRIQEIACWAHVRRKFYDCNKRTHRSSPARLWNESQLCMSLRRRFAGVHRTNGNRFAQHGRGRCSSPCTNASKSR